MAKSGQLTRLVEVAPRVKVNNILVSEATDTPTTKEQPCGDADTEKATDQAGA